ncbi:phosphotransferase enzyme family protein [Ornithinibacillus salinisoli]|uniref:Phosphotransferase enzyme family protein n=1 Tax=Ornithinibacillus salinisoli TaxID=1848459 RepID=A0ABW4W1B4_9BACI
MMDNILLSKGAKRFGVKVSDLELIGGFSNNVFECKSTKQNFILKFYLSTIYEKSSIEAEIDWISYLLMSDLHVTAPIPSQDGHLMEILPLDHGEACYVVGFEKAKGAFIDISSPHDWNTDFYYRWGKTLGRIHFLSKKYKPSNPRIRRQDWNKGKIFIEENGVTDGVRQKWDMYIKELEQLPKGENAYGMIHNDLHHKNFYIDNSKIILFDFGDCEYNWFVYDIAIVIYHALQTMNGNGIQQRREFARLFMNSFIEGYHTENQLCVEWINKLPFFLNYRQLYSYMYFSKFLTQEQKNNKKINQILHSMKHKIENDIPYIDFQLEIGLFT